MNRLIDIGAPLQWLLVERPPGTTPLLLALPARALLRLHGVDEMQPTPNALPAPCLGIVSHSGERAIACDLEQLFAWEGVGRGSAWAWLDARACGVSLALRIGRCLRLSPLPDISALPQRISEHPAMAGMAVLPDGQPVLTLNPAALLPADLQRRYAAALLKREAVGV